MCYAGPSVPVADALDIAGTLDAACVSANDSFRGNGVRSADLNHFGAPPRFA